MKTYKSLIVAIFIFFISLCLLFISLYQYELSPTSKDDTIIEIEIPSGTSRVKVAKMLKKEGIIKNDKAFYYYIRLKKYTIKASTYELSKDMGVKKIAKILNKGNIYNPNSVRITFQEGININKIASIIENNTNNKKEDVLNKAKDKAYLKMQIKKYWFLTDDILDDNIYYGLEGYLYPDTYEFENKDVTIEEIFTKMLDQEEKKLKTYKETIYERDENVHKIITIASICELEGSEKYRKDIAGVFYNRLDKGMNLGSDVTTYYGANVDMKERDLTTDEINKSNAYNTRSNALAGKLPAGPVSNPSISSIEAALNPNKHNYYYFVADKYKKVYFTKTGAEHLQLVENIKKRGDWIEW